MNSDLIFRVILAILFVIVIGVRRYFEIRSARVAKKDLVQDLDSRSQTRLQSLLLTVSNLAMIV